MAFGSLRTRLIAAFAIVILAALFTAGSAIVWLVQDYQHRISVDRLTEVAMAASLAGRQLEVAEFLPDEIASTVSNRVIPQGVDRKSTRLNSSHLVISYAVSCLKKKIRQ